MADNIFTGLNKLLELAQELQKNGNTQREESFTTQSGLNGVFGVSVRSVGGEARVEPFGNVKSEGGQTRVDEVREPLTDVLEQEGGYLVIVELPGVDANTIALHFEANTMRLEASGTARRRYAKRLEFNKAIAPDSAKRSHQNGILELFLPFVP
jgi:HSP20 family molecular chaperone IbpA